MRTLLPSLLMSTLVAVPAFGVSTSHWVHTRPADFKGGKFENVVATNLGDLKLSRDVKKLLEQDPRVSAVYCMAEGPDGTVYAGTGPQGVVLAIKDGKVTTAATLKEDQNIFAIAVDAKGRLLLGTGGEQGRVLRVDEAGEEPKELFVEKDVQYVWSLKCTVDGNAYAATGPNGQLFEITPDGKHTVLFDSDENNFLSLASDGKDLLYVGTDPNGLVYRVNRKTKESFVVYDAGETEVSCLALGADGTLYAGTSEATPEDAGAAGAEAPAAEHAGRPEGEGGATPIPSTPPKEPVPPSIPDPNPPHPDPIPKHSSADTTAKPQTAGKAEVKSVAPVKGSAEAEAPEGAPEPKAPSAPANAPAHGANANAAGAMPNPEGNGNAIYRIDRDGFVTEVFRENVMILSMVEHNGTLLVGTGSEGDVYQVSPAAEETVVLAKVDPKQVMSLLAAKDGQVYLGLANAGSVATLSSGLASAGTYTSTVLDANQISRFGKIALAGSLPKGSSLKLSTRSGNVASADAKGWSEWSEPVAAAQYMDVKAPNARFLQYRLSFATTDAGVTPVVDQVDVAYETPNQAPRMSNVKLAGEDKGEGGDHANGNGGEASGPKARGTGVQTVTWEASDPNEDAMVYALYYRNGVRSPWILLKDDVKESTFKWDTRSVGDGEYQVRVVASDEAANPLGTGKRGSRVSDPLFVDNTPPAIGDLKWSKAAKAVRVQLRAVDKASTVASVEYAVDSSDHWQAVLPSDNIFDSPEETVVFTVPDLKAGRHQVTVRATDAHGNQAFESLLVTVD